MDVGTAIAIGSNVLGGIFGRRSAKKAARQRAEAIRGAYSKFRAPEDILGEAYTTGIYGKEPMQAILGREIELIPEFQTLQATRAFGAADIARDIQEESKQRQLDIINKLGGDIRSILEDPRLAEIAESQMDIAEQATARAKGPLSPEVAREAEQTALSTAVRQGRERGQSAIAQTILGRTRAQQQQERFAQDSLSRAMQAAFQAKIDPYQFMFGAPSAEERMATTFLGGALAPQVTDPGYAFNLGQMADQRAAEAILGQGLARAQGTAAAGKILGQTISGVAGSLGNLFTPQAPTASVPSFASMQQTAAPMLAPQTLQYNMPTTGFSGGGFTFGP